MMNLSTKILDFNFKFRAFVAYAEANASDLMLSTEIIGVLTEDRDNWDLKFTPYVTPDDHGPISIGEINVAFEEYAPVMETTKIGIRDNTAIVLSIRDLMNLDIKLVDKRHSKILPPDFGPSIGLVELNHLELIIFAMNPAHPTDKKKPKGAKFYGSSVAYTDAAATEPDAGEFRNRAMESKSIFSILYGTDKVGKKIWVKCWYISPTGVASDAVSVVFSVVLV